MSCFVIAEAGVNHNGSSELASRLIEAAASAGADAVKFQTFQAELLVKRGAEKANYQKTMTGDGDQFSMLKALELRLDWHEPLIQRCEQLGIEFMSTAFDERSADFLVSLGVRRLKIPSGELTNYPLLAHLAAKGLPIILSTGMGTLQEVREAIEAIRATRDEHGLGEPLAEVVTLLHCTSNYPTALEDVNLRAMNTLAREFALPVGYSDHTEGVLVAPVAVGLGASVIEKHFTLSRSLPGPDHKASLEPDELARMVADIRAAERCLGDGVKEPRPSELPVRDVVRRSIMLKRTIDAGHVLTSDDLVLLRPDGGIPPKDLSRVIGKGVARELPAGHTLQWADLQP